MSLGAKDLLKPGARVFAGAQKSEGGKLNALFIFVGEEGVVPPM
jgi:hypothetical protein